MIRTLCSALAVSMALVGPASGHALDEYVQAAIISLQQDRIDVSMRLKPGVAVWPEVFGGIDVDSDRVISETEQRKYAERMLRDLSLSVDRNPLELRLVSADFPAIDRMKEGLGEIHLELTASLPAGNAQRKLVFENHHLSRISAYLANCVAPSTPNIRIIAQTRADDQSVYQLDFVAGVRQP